MHIPEKYRQEPLNRSFDEHVQVSNKVVETSRTDTPVRKKFEFPASITAAGLAIAALLGTPAVHTVANGQVDQQFGSLDQAIGTVLSINKAVAVEEDSSYIEPIWISEVEEDGKEIVPEEEEVQETVAETPEAVENTPEESAPPAEPEPEIVVPMAEVDDSIDFSHVMASDFQGLSLDEKVELIGKMAREDDKRTGIPASLTAAQAIIESGWMESGLTTNYENYYGIKASSDGYNWPDSTWDGRVADLATGEEYGGASVEIVAGFRVYDNAWQSMQDHSAYLLNNTRNNGAERRYPDIEKCETAEEAIDIVIEGGYATSSSYRSTIMSAVEKYDLTRFDYTAEDAAMDAEATLAARAEKTEQIKKEQTEASGATIANGIAKLNVKTPDSTEDKTV